MKTASQLAKTIHSKYLGLLNLYRFMQQEGFAQAYDIATETEKEEAARLIENVDQVKLTFWVKNTLRKYHQLEYLDVRELRDMARDRSVIGYAAASKIELVSMILIREKGNGRTCG